jgi:FkbM family methyltransferase
MQVVRTIIERLSRRVVLRRHMPHRLGGGVVFVSPDAALRFFRPDLEAVDPNLIRNAEALVRPSDVIWDIGANVGIFSFAAAAVAGPSGRVLSVEADTWLVDLLRRSAREQPPASAPVDVLPAAVAEQVGVAHFVISARGRAANHLAGAGSTQTGGAREEHHVVTITLDWLLASWPAPALVKIDVEGAEARVLTGGERLLSEARPLLICEVCAESSDRVVALLKERDYVLMDAEVPPRERRLITKPVWNTLALPKERARALKDGTVEVIRPGGAD